MNLKNYFFLLGLLFQLMSYGQTFNVDDINYNITSASNPLTVEVGVNFMMMSNTVVIPETVTYNSNTYLVTAIGEAAFIDSHSLISVLIPNSVTSIGNMAFAMCNDLTSVTIPNSVISIGELAFDHCTSLQTVNIGNSVTSIGNLAFGMCYNLTTVINNSTTPLVIDPLVFSDEFEQSINRTLYVPYSAVAAYQNTAVWQGFNSILPIVIPATHLNFDGVDDYVEITQAFNASFSIEFQIKTTETGAVGSQWYYGKSIIDNEVAGVSTDFGTTLVGNKLAFGIGQPDTTIFSVSDINDGNWNHVAVTWEQSTGLMEIYINGVLEATGVGSTDQRVASNLIRLATNNYLGNYHNCNLDDVRIWNLVRTAEQIAGNKDVELQGNETGLVAYYDFNQGLDSQDNTPETILLDGSENSTHGTLHNFELLGSESNWLAGSPITTSANYLNFGNSNDFIDCGNDPSLQITGNTITLEAYVKFNSFASAAYLGNIIDKDEAFSSFNSGYMLRAGGNGVVNFALGNSGWNETNSPENSISLNTWHHIAGVYDGTTAKIFVDGVEVASNEFTMNIGNANRNLNIGKDPQFDDRFLDAAIDDVRIWNIARTPNQINLSKNCELQGTETGLVAYYKFNQGLNANYNASELQLFDASGNGNDGILNSFSLFESTSNWLKGSPLTSGVVIPTVPTVNETQIFCGSAIVADIEVIGNSLKWYNSAISNTVLSTNMALATGVYYVSDSNTNGCESERTMVNVTVSEFPEAPTTTGITYTQGDVATALTATSVNANLLWYEVATGGNSNSEAPTPSTENAGETSYWVSSVNDAGCESDRVEIVVTVNEVLNLGENELLHKVKIYPNPTDAQVSIVLANTEDTMVMVYDLNGRLLLQESHSSTQINIDLSHYQTGVYLLKVKMNDKELIKRVIKQ